MALLDILLYPDPRLRTKLKPVTEITAEIRKLLEDMAETMYHAPGIGLAAAQVGAPYRVIVVDVGSNEESGRKACLYKIVNPEIRSRTGSTETEEGCLSIPDIREIVERSAQVTVEGLDENGKPLTINATGILAVCLQHEIDHLDGVLFIDRLSRLKREVLKPQLREFEHRTREKVGR